MTRSSAARRCTRGSPASPTTSRATSCDCIRIGREIVADLNWRKLGPAPHARRRRAAPRRRRAARDRVGRPPRAVRPARGARTRRRRLSLRRVQAARTARASSPVGRRSTAIRSGILANAQGVLFMAESKKATEFIMLANQIDTPLVFLQNTTGYMVGPRVRAGRDDQGRRQDDQRGHEQHGAAPHGDDGRVVRRRELRHVRSRVRPALPVRVAELEDGGDGPATARRRDVDRGPRVGRGHRARVRRGGRRAQRQAIEEQIERESHAFFNSGKIYDDGVIDPRDTRTVLGIALSAVHSNVVEGRRGWGVFRM